MNLDTERPLIQDNKEVLDPITHKKIILSLSTPSKSIEDNSSDDLEREEIRGVHDLEKMTSKGK